MLLSDTDKFLFENDTPTTLTSFYSSAHRGKELKRVLRGIDTGVILTFQPFNVCRLRKGSA